MGQRAFIVEEVGVASGCQHQLRPLVEERGEFFLFYDQRRVVANFIVEDSHAARAGDGRFFVAAFLALRDELLAFVRAQQVVDKKNLLPMSEILLINWASKGRAKTRDEVKSIFSL